jgi:hypothetical protein
MSIAHHHPSTNPPAIPLWDVPNDHSQVASDYTQQSDASTQPKVSTDFDEKYLQNPEPENEHVGVDEEGLYIDLG